jgi:hypothetical protein
MQAGRQNPFPPGLGYDPARPAGPLKQQLITNTRCELPAAAYAFASGIGFLFALEVSILRLFCLFTFLLERVFELKLYKSC